MAIKFGRNYKLTVGLENGQSVIITPPLTIEFDIKRRLIGNLNNSQIRLYNLSKINRDLLRYDLSAYGIGRPLFLELRAGYGQNLPVIFYGNFSQAWSAREGVNFITTIQCFDGGEANSTGMIPSNLTFPAGMSLKSKYETLMGKGLSPAQNIYLPYVTFGAIGPSFYQTPTGQPLYTTRSDSPMGNTLSLFRKRFPNSFFIDSGKAFLLGNAECRQGQISKIDTSTGLLGTPIREKELVSFEMIFEPSLQIGQLLDLESVTDVSFNSNVSGFYKVNSFSHAGMISESVCGEVITRVELVRGVGKLGVVTNQ